MLIGLSSYLPFQSSYSLSPFDLSVVGYDLVITAITVTAVFALLFITGLLGHCCVLAFFTCCKRSRCIPAYVLISNLTAAHAMFIIVCLPLAAYTFLMDMTTHEWLLGDLICRLNPFLNIFLLGVTSLSFFAFAIDRFQSATQVNKTYDHPNDSFLRGFCKVLALWIGALLLASPEFFLAQTSVIALPAFNEAELPPFLDLTDLPTDIFLWSKEEYKTYQNCVSQRGEFVCDSQFLATTDNSLRGFNETYKPDFRNTSKIYVQYETCSLISSWNNSFSPAMTLLISNYAYYRDWWFLGFYFFLPVVFSLVLVLIASRRLILGLKKASDNPVLFTGSYYMKNALDGGTLTSQRDAELNSFLDFPTHRSNSLVSNHPHMSDALYQLRGGYSLDRQVSYNQYPRRLSPVLSAENLNDGGPTVIVPNGSIRTVDSFRRMGEFPPPSPLSPPYTTAAGVSLLSLAMSANGHGTIGTASLPPHGHRRSMKRNSRISKKTMDKINEERSLNLIFVFILLTFIVTQLPLAIVSILLNQTEVFTLLESNNAELLLGLCRYFFYLTFVLNPIVVCLSYKTYRKFLIHHFCCCCCSRTNSCC